MSGPPAVELERPRRIHLVGAGGAGMSGIAEILAAMGHRVSGSDERPSSALERLGALGLRTAVGHHPDNLGDAELVACSSAIPAGNVEAAAARAGGLPVLSRAELLGAICRQRRTVAVAGGSGKTTTTAMLALILAEAGLAPSFLVGGELVGLGCGARWDRGEHFVVEADESDGSFLALGAYAAIVTTVEADHLDHWGSFEALQAGFARFLAAASGPKVVGADDPGAAALAAAVPGAQTYGQGPGAHWRLTELRSGPEGVRAHLARRGEALGELAVPFPGAHNAANAAAAAALAVLLGAPFAAAQAALAGYRGVRRRFERRGEAGGVRFVDDYAHLPGKVAAALAAGRALGPARLVAVFQPHRYTRTEALWREFGEAFAAADVLVVTDVYAAGEAARPGVTGRLIADAAAAAAISRAPRPAGGGPGAVHYEPDRARVAARVAALLAPGDLCLSIGAGDITTLADEVRPLLDPPGRGRTAQP